MQRIRGNFNRELRRGYLTRPFTAMTTSDSDSAVYNAHWAMFPLLFAKRYTLRTYANFKASRARTKVGPFASPLPARIDQLRSYLIGHNHRIVDVLRLPH